MAVSGDGDKVAEKGKKQSIVRTLKGVGEKKETALPPAREGDGNIGKQSDESRMIKAKVQTNTNQRKKSEAQKKEVVNPGYHEDSQAAADTDKPTDVTAES